MGLEVVRPGNMVHEGCGGEGGGGKVEGIKE
jgi:hypothetical protein